MYHTHASSRHSWADPWLMDDEFKGDTEYRIPTEATYCPNWRATFQWVEGLVRDKNVRCQSSPNVYPGVSMGMYTRAVNRAHERYITSKSTSFPLLAAFHAVLKVGMDLRPFLIPHYLAPMPHRPQPEWPLVSPIPYLNNHGSEIYRRSLGRQSRISTSSRNLALKQLDIKPHGTHGGLIIRSQVRGLVVTYRFLVNPWAVRKSIYNMCRPLEHLLPNAQLAAKLPLTQELCELIAHYACRPLTEDYPLVRNQHTSPHSLLTMLEFLRDWE